MKKLIGLLKSKTFWVNLIGVILQIVNNLQGEIIPTEYAIAIQGILNIIIRFFTTESLDKK